MKILEFKYKKDDDKEPSERMFLALKEPFPDYAGYDLSELSEYEYCEFIEKLRELQENFHNLFVTFDLRKSYRRFKPDKMSEVTTIDL